MRYFPLFADLRGRRALVVGGGEVAARKVRHLLEAGAEVRIVAREVGEEIAALLAKVHWIAREFDPAQLAGASLVVAATDDRELNARVAAAGRDANLFVNVVDDPELSSFIVPAIVDRSPLVIAISSGGVAPSSRGRSESASKFSSTGRSAHWPACSNGGARGSRRHSPTSLVGERSTSGWFVETWPATCARAASRTRSVGSGECWRNDRTQFAEASRWSGQAPEIRAC
jgi:hypothetical protein